MATAKLTKYDMRPTIKLDADGNGEVILFRGGQKLCYMVYGEVIKFNPNKSGRCDGGVDGAHEVCRSFRNDGYKYVATIVKKHREPQKVRAGHG